MSGQTEQFTIFDHDRSPIALSGHGPPAVLRQEMFVPVDAGVIVIVIDNGDIFVSNGDDINECNEDDIDDPDNEDDNIEPTEGNGASNTV